MPSTHLNPHHTKRRHGAIDAPGSPVDGAVDLRSVGHAVGKDRVGGIWVTTWR